MNSITVLWDTVVGAIWSRSCVILDAKICMNQILEKYNQWWFLGLNATLCWIQMAKCRDWVMTTIFIIQFSVRKENSSTHSRAFGPGGKGKWLVEMILSPLHIFADTLALFYSEGRLCPPYYPLYIFRPSYSPADSSTWLTSKGLDGNGRLKVPIIKQVTVCQCTFVLLYFRLTRLQIRTFKLVSLPHCIVRWCDRNTKSRPTIYTF